MKNFKKIIGSFGKEKISVTFLLITGSINLWQDSQIKVLLRKGLISFGVKKTIMT